MSYPFFSVFVFFFFFFFSFCLSLQVCNCVMLSLPASVVLFFHSSLFGYFIRPIFYRSPFVLSCFMLFFSSEYTAAKCLLSVLASASLSPTIHVQQYSSCLFSPSLFIHWPRNAFRFSFPRCHSRCCHFYRFITLI